MVDIHKEIREKRSGSKMIMQIHDELVFDVEKKELKSFSAMVRKKMETVMELSVPVRVDMKTGKNWSEMEEIK
jgi:DNA polymerase I